MKAYNKIVKLKRRIKLKDNLFDFCDEKIDFSKTEKKEENKQKMLQEAQKLQKKIEEECVNSGVDVDKAKNLYEKYKNYSTQDLLAEFYNVVNAGKQNGTLTEDKITKTVESLKPFLNENQKQFLDTILRGGNE